MNITFLGTGTSHGVPNIDCMLQDFKKCPKGVCKESAIDPKHNRTRSSIRIEYQNKNIIVDISMDFRQQALREKIPGIDAVLITHYHADHIMGLPDIRSYNNAAQPPIPVYGSLESLNHIKKTFPYIFDSKTVIGGGIPRLCCYPVTSSFLLWDLPVTPLRVEHGMLSGCVGYRIGSIAYIPDMKAISEQKKSLLKNLDYLIIDCLRETRPHTTHIILPESIALARELKPKKCLFTHLSHDIHYQKDVRYLDSWMDFAWDGLTVVI